MALESTELLPIDGVLYADEGTDPVLPVVTGSYAGDLTRPGIDDILGDITTLGTYRARYRRHWVVEGDGNELSCSIVSNQIQIATGSACLDGRVHRNTGAYTLPTNLLASTTTWYITMEQAVIGGVYSASFKATASGSWTNPAGEFLLCTVDSNGSALSNLVDRRWYTMVGNGRASDLLHVEGIARIEGALRLGDGTDATAYLYAYNADANKPGLRYYHTGNVWQYSNDGTTWSDLGSGGGGTKIEDADADTKVDVEESADEDTIRFDVAGTERATVDATDWRLKHNILRLGDGTDATMYLYAQNADTNKPGLRYNASTNQWELSNDGSSWSAMGASIGMTSFTLSADSGSDQTIENGNTLELTGGTGIDTVASATDTVTINLNAAIDDLSDVTLTTPAQGDVLYRNASGWVNLPPGTSGHVLQTQGAGANPQWAAVSGGASALDDLTDVTITTPVQGAIIMLGDTVWENLSPGTAGYFLTSNGAGADLSWAAGVGDLEGLSDVSVSGAAHGALLYKPASGVWTGLAPSTAGYMLSTNGSGSDPAWISVGLDTLADVTLGSTAAGDMLYLGGAGQWVNLAKGTGLQVFRMNSGATAPEWADFLGNAGWVIAMPATGGVAGRHFSYKVEVTSVKAYCIGGTSVAFNLENRTTVGSSGSDIGATEFTANVAGDASLPTLQNKTILADSHLYLDISGVTGSVTQVAVTVYYKRVA